MLKNKKLRISDYILQENLLYYHNNSKYICFIGLKINFTLNNIENNASNLTKKCKITYIFDIKQSNYLIFIRFETKSLTKAQKLSQDFNNFFQTKENQIIILSNDLLLSSFFYLFEGYTFQINSVLIKSYPFEILDKTNHNQLFISIINFDIEKISEQNQKLIHSYISNKKLQVFYISNKIIKSIYEFSLLLVADSINSIEKFEEFLKSLSQNKKNIIKQINLEIFQNLITKKIIGSLKFIKDSKYFEFVKRWSSTILSSRTIENSKENDRDQIIINQISQILKNSQYKLMENNIYYFDQQKILVGFINELKEDMLSNILTKFYSIVEDIILISEDITYNFLITNTKIKQLKKIHIYKTQNLDLAFSSIKSKYFKESIDAFQDIS